MIPHPRGDEIGQELVEKRDKIEQRYSLAKFSGLDGVLRKSFDQSERTSQVE